MNKKLFRIFAEKMAFLGSYISSRKNSGNTFMYNQKRIGLNCILILCISSLSFNSYSQCTGPANDCDGDGIVNSIDLDDDNDGILDVNEARTAGTANWTSTQITNIETTAFTTTVAGCTNVGFKLNDLTNQVANVVANTTVDFGPVLTQDLGVSTSLNPVAIFNLDFPNNANLANITYTVPAGRFESFNVYLADPEHTSFLIQAYDASNNLIPTTDWSSATFEQTNPAIPANQLGNVTFNATSARYTAIDVTQDRDVFRIRFGEATMKTATRIVITMSRNDQTNTASDGVFFFVSGVCLGDTDGDGIVDKFDLDSDGDGCPDAIEGGGAFNNTNTTPFSPTPAPGGGGRITGAVDANGVPVAAGTNGQTVGTSANASVQDPACTPPTANNDAVWGTIATPVTIPNLLGNDVKSPNGAALTPEGVSLITPSGATGITTDAQGDVTGFTVPGQGAWTYNSTNGSLTFTPVTGYTGNPTPINYTVKSPEGAISNQATVTITYVNLCAISASNPDSDGDGISDLCDQDDDNDGILNIKENNQEIIQNGTFTGGSIFPLGNGTSTTLFPGWTATNAGTVGTIDPNNGVPWLTVDGGVSSLKQTINTTACKLGRKISMGINWNEGQSTDPTNYQSTLSILYSGIEYARLTTSYGNGPSGSQSGTFSYYNGANGNLSSIVSVDPVATSTALSNWEIIVPSGLTAGGVLEIKMVGGDFPGDDFKIDNISWPSYFDTDGDGICDYLDLDSDNDGCVDAIEGSANVLPTHLATSAGTVSVGTGSMATNQNLCGSAACVDANGLPTILGTLGTPNGQLVGTSANASQQDPYCTLPSVDPDFNSGFVNNVISGNMATNNNNFPTGTVFSTIPIVPTGVTNPSSDKPTVNADGTYTFTTAVPGVYTFDVLVCEPSPGTLCLTNRLTVTVAEPTATNNPPVANPDLATTQAGTPVSLNTLGNDRPGANSAVLNPASVVITGQPAHGTVTVDPATGNTTYTPNPGYVGTDTLRYQVCDQASPTPRCTESYQLITVTPLGINTTSAADDYATTAMNTPASGNVLTNDVDAEGNNKTVSTPGSYTIPGKGTLVLNTNGTYTFTPVSGFTGPVNFPYTICDDGTPQACDKATLYVLVAPTIVPLPVTLISFDVLRSGDCMLALNWKVGNEDMVASYQVEESMDGQVYTAVAIPVAATGSGSSYRQIIEVKPTGHARYYRLKISDLDHQVSFSKILKVQDPCSASAEQIELYPNPSGDKFYLKGLHTSANIEIYDLSGRLLLKQELKAGSIEESVNIRNLIPGIYYVKALTMDGTHIFKLIKK